MDQNNDIGQLYGSQILDSCSSPRDKLRPKDTRKAKNVLDTRLRIAEEKLAKDLYIFGNEFTLIDIQLGHILFRYFEINIPHISCPIPCAFLSPTDLLTTNVSRTSYGLL